MKDMKIYNIIFPLWFVLFLPPIILLTLIGNFIIDSLVVIFCFYMYRLSREGYELGTFYKNNIVKVWLFGFIGDAIGAAALFLIQMLTYILNLNSEWISAANFYPFENTIAVTIIIICILIAGVFIFLFNYLFMYKDINNKKLKFKISLTVALITMPWTFLVPSKLIYEFFK